MEGTITSISAERKQQDQLLRAVNTTAAALLSSEGGERFDTALRQGVELIALSMDLDRVHIWRNETNDGGSYYAAQFEWLNERSRRENFITGQAAFPCENTLGWESRFLKGECVNGPVSDLDRAERDRLECYGVKSVFAIPVFLQDHYWGFVSFDDCRRERTFTQDEIIILRSASMMMVGALDRNAQAIEIHNAHERTNTVNIIAGILLQSGIDEFDNNLHRCMGMLGESVDADRMYIWENYNRDGRLYCAQLYEWSPRQDGRYPADMAYGEDLPGWEETLSNGYCVNGLVRNMTPEKQARFSLQGILSILIVPVFLKEKFWGFVGFDDRLRERVFSQNDEAILRSGSLIIVHALIRNEMNRNIHTAAANLESALGVSRAASLAKSNFLSNMSHEMRTPMNAIIGMTLIGKTASDLEKKDYAFEKIEGASTHLLGVINDVLDMSKIEAGKFELSSVIFNFEKTLQRTVNVIGFRVDEKHQKLTVNIDKNIPGFLTGDDQRLTQVIANLLSNAVKFTPPQGSVYVDTRLADEENGLCTVEIRVRDTGIGISREQQSRLFNSFEQAENSTSRKFGGTGLGLAISKHIVELMGGHIWIESELGKGASFIFTVKLKRGEEKGTSPLPGADISGIRMPEPTETFKGRRILVAEDVEINREIVEAVFEPLQIDIDFAVDGLEAVKKFTAAPETYDLIFMDLQMPEMDGLEAARKIRSHNSPNASEIPIVAMTANVFKEDVEKCLEAGMNDHIGKPLDFEAVTEKLKQYLTNEK